MKSLTHISRAWSRSIAAFSVLLGLAAPSPLLAADITISPMITDGERRLFNLSVHSYAGEDILEAVKRGIEAKVSFTMEIVKESALDMLFSNVVSSRACKRSLRYDYWNRAYIISEGNRKTQYHNENQMFSHLFRINNFHIPEKDLAPGGTYRLRARAELKSVELYFPMSLIFKYIVGYWDFRTGWIYSHEFWPIR